MIAEHLVDEVRARADIVELIGEHVPLKRAGKDFRALCPFHQEKTPSFYVVPSKGFYKCFGCGESGDVFTFLMKRTGLGFQDAVRQVAQRVGVDIPRAAGARPADERYRPLYEAIAFAADFFRERLAESERARKYLAERGLGAEAVERFRLGYAPDDWRALREAAHRHGIADDVLLTAGLIKESEHAEEAYDRLRDRIVFPTADVTGRLVAFGGRILGRAAEGVPKYLNSPDTPIYHKGRVLYGLNWSRAAIRRQGEVLVVEGYLDYVSLAARGVENVAAALGTAMTEEQAALLARYTDRALLLYDSDAAGLRATFRSADALLRAAVHPLVVTLPPGEDPDALVRKHGADALRPFLDGAVDVLDRKLQILEERGYLQDVEGRRKALDGLLPTLRAAADAALRDIYVARVAERTGVRRETLEAELEVEYYRAPTRGSASAPAGALGLAGQRKLLLLLLRDESRIAHAAERLAPEEFGDRDYREVYVALLGAGGLKGRGPAVLDLSDGARGRLEALLADPEELTEGDRIFEDSINDIRAEGLYRRLDDVDRQVASAQAAGDEAHAGALALEKRELMQTLRSMGYPLERLFRKHSRRERPRPST